MDSLLDTSSFSDFRVSQKSSNPASSALLSYGASTHASESAGGNPVGAFVGGNMRRSADLFYPTQNSSSSSSSSAQMAMMSPHPPSLNGYPHGHASMGARTYAKPDSHGNMPGLYPATRRRSVPVSLPSPPSSAVSSSNSSLSSIGSTATSATSISSSSATTSSTTTIGGHGSAVYSQQEIYSFLLVSKELQAAADFVSQLLHLGGLHNDILLSEFKTIFVDLMAEKFSEVWDIRQPKKGAGYRTVSHAPNLPHHHLDPILHHAFVLCHLDPKLLFTLLPVSFSLTITPGLVAYTTSDVDGFQPVHLFEARPYLPPKHQEPVDHGAEARMRAMKSLAMGQVNIAAFDLDRYFDGGSASGISRRLSVV